MPQILDTLLNGNVYSFSSIKLGMDVPGAPPLLTRFIALNYRHGLAPGELRGTSPKVLGTTVGEYSASGDMQIYLEDWTILKAGLMALPRPLGGGFMEKRFLITVNYASFGCVPVTDILRGVRITESAANNQRGTDPTMKSLTLHVMELIENGTPAVIHPGSPP